MDTEYKQPDNTDERTISRNINISNTITQE